MTLRAVGVSLRYPGSPRPAVGGVTAGVDRGELVVIGGPNGSGKSTLLRMLAGMAASDSGEVLLDGRPVSALSRERLAARIGVLPQREETVFPMRVRDAVLLGLWSRLGPFAPVGKAERVAVERAIGRCDLEHLADRITDSLSGGEWQRVRIARALVSEPEYLLLDEPGTSLDMAHEMALFELLRELTGSGIGSIVVTHELNIALRHADRMILMSSGSVAIDGGVADLDSAAASRVFGWPIAVSDGPDGRPQLHPLRREDGEGTRTTRNGESE